MNNEPIKHHYIPQFILRNFCFDDQSHLYYYEKRSSEIFIKKTQEVFMVKNLYRDEINYPDVPTKIEKDLACFESQVSQIITEKFLYEDKISITLEEDEKLRLFFAIMAFRSKITSNSFMAGMSETAKKIYSIYQKNEDLSDFWKRNLGNLVNCRSLKEVLNHAEIDAPIKGFFIRDTFGYSGLYFVVAERRGSVDFIISDVYPTLVTGETDTGFELPLYSINPISPNRIILLVANGIKKAPKKVTVLSDEVLKKPKLSSDKKILINVKKIYENEVKYLNSMLINAVHEGFAFKSENRVIFPDTKYNGLLRTLG